MGATHALTGVTAGAVLSAVVSTIGLAPDAVALLVIPLAAYAALLPDLDHPRSTVTYSVGPVTIVASWILRRFVEHRGPTHDVRAAPVAFGLPPGLGALAVPALAPWCWLVGLAVAVGVVVHIWGDARTPQGVPWKGRRATIGRTFRTGSRREVQLRASVYRPAALVAVAGAVLAAGAT